jgi:outer membrane protein assembly factor BamE (lipoprotein component of BamABCDE complex)
MRSFGTRYHRLTVMLPAARRWTTAASLAAALAACAPVTTKHGHQFRESDIQQIQPGMTSDSVRLALGTPATTSTVAGGNSYYYISSTETQSAFFKPTEVDRKVLAVYFNPTGSVDRVAHYGMKDGQIFDYVKRETPSHVRDQGLLKQIFRGIGQRALFE